MPNLPNRKKMERLTVNPFRLVATWYREFEPARRPDAETALADPQHVDVYSLADQGKSARQIADTLGRPSGEIELILALRSTG